MELMSIIEIIDRLQGEIERYRSKNFSISPLAFYEIRFFHSFLILGDLAACLPLPTGR